MNKTEPKLDIEGRAVSADSPAFIVAEAACNHLCDIKLALKLIDAASAAGADAIKFQTYSAEKLTSRKAKAYGNIQTKSQYEYYKQFDRFGRSEYDELFDYAKEKKIIAFSTPFDPESAQILNSVHQPVFKIASCDILYTDLLREVACFNKPIILSTGGSRLDEIRKALDVLAQAGAREIALLACTMCYPTKPEDANYRRITALKREFPEVVVGVSDHVEPEEHMISGSICTALGASVFEKHFTLDRTMGGGSSLSMNPADLAKYVANIRLAERLLGSDELKVYPAEETTRENARRSLVANEDIKAGTILSKEMIGVKRPGTGISPDRIDEFVGRKLKNDLESEAQLEWAHLI
jgi:N-acetylneuraminate synthase